MRRFSSAEYPSSTKSSSLKKKKSAVIINTGLVRGYTYHEPQVWDSCTPSANVAPTDSHHSTGIAAFNQRPFFENGYSGQIEKSPSTRGRRGNKIQQHLHVSTNHQPSRALERVNNSSNQKMISPFFRADPRTALLLRGTFACRLFPDLPQRIGPQMFSGSVSPRCRAG